MTDIELLIKYVSNKSDLINHDREIFEILEGDLQAKIERKMRGILISDRAFNGATKLIPPINLLRQVNNKLSTIYAQAPTREAKKDNDQILLDFYADEAEVNTAFHQANKFFNAQKRVALEPFIQDGEPGIRVLGAHQFLPYSSNMANPLRMTEFVKFMGEKDDKEFYFIYSDHGFVAVNEDGEVLPEYMQDNGGVNPYGVLPQTYIKKSRSLLVPLKDSDTIQMSVLLPCMWASINYGINFQAHSLLYGIDIDFENIEMNPDSFLVFKSDGDKKPEIGTIKPEIDIEQVDNHILDLFNAWLESMNIRPGEAVGVSQSSVSGVALAIKEMDTTMHRREQVRYFYEAEKDFWYKLKVMHNYWVDTGKLKNLPKFSQDFSPSITFGDIKPSEDMDMLVDREIKKLKANLTTIEMALKRLHPDLSQDEIDTMVLELEPKPMFLDEEIDAEESSLEES